MTFFFRGSVKKKMIGSYNLEVFHSTTSAIIFSLTLFKSLVPGPKSKQLQLEPKVRVHQIK